MQLRNVTELFFKNNFKLSHCQTEHTKKELSIKKLCDEMTEKNKFLSKQNLEVNLKKKKQRKCSLKEYVWRG